MKTQIAFKTQAGKNEIMKAYDSFLQKWVSPCKEIYTDTRYGKTHIIASGEKSAPPLILLHGTGMNSIMWIGEVREYSKSYRVYAVDIPGEPGKSDETQFSLEGASYTEWLYDVLDANETIPLFTDNELKKLTMPTALFVGEKNIMLHSVKTAERLRDLVPYATINILPDVGHSIVNLADKIKVFLADQL
ncbi:alpha/beta hydrolase [Tissierella sp. MSJ-40]|uniref:Alpha/beta hydrolase n=1 Tax=Tissierella simiarum TaxID=2841534 RepID=A0ABS6E9H1_9FIRM|nr:alpha/beta hydrolase [Tissierella simiarum]MBU5439561.1 alpha/beta hydrolase [Tissierella simiarum]